LIDIINKEAFGLIELISFIPKEIVPKKTELKGSLGEREVVDLTGKLIGNIKKRGTNHLGDTTSYFIEDENGSYGFNESVFDSFKSLIKKIESFNGIGKTLSTQFLEEKLLIWAVEVYKKKVANISFYDHILLLIDKKVRPYTFYFPILNLEIETFFKIGNVDFMYFSKDFFEKHFEKLKETDKNITEENYDKTFKKDFQGKVLAKVTICAEKEKAEKLAMQEAENSVDVLKLFCETVFVSEKKTMFDLNFRLVYQLQSNYLSHGDIENELTVNTKNTNAPYIFTNQHYTLAKSLGLGMFSEFISHPMESELSKIIIQSIHLFSSAISNWDLNIRCVNLISIIESIFLKGEEQAELEKKTKARLSKVLSDQHQEKERVKTLFSGIYQVRHKMIHKAIRLKIDYAELSEAQKTMTFLFLKLILLNTKSGYTDKNTLIEYLNGIKS